MLRMRVWLACMEDEEEFKKKKKKPLGIQSRD